MTEQEWVNIELGCHNCGKLLRVLLSDNQSAARVAITGLRRFLYQHQDGSGECNVRKFPEAYSSWDATAAYNKACKAKGDTE